MPMPVGGRETLHLVQTEAQIPAGNVDHTGRVRRALFGAGRLVETHLCRAGGRVELDANQAGQNSQGRELTVGKGRQDMTQARYGDVVNQTGGKCSGSVHHKSAP